MQIRKAMESDLERLTAIYNQAILDGNRTCDTEPFPTEARRAWLLEHDQERFPLFTCLLKGKVVGYAYLSPYRSGRPALADTAEISCYLDFSIHGQGIGSRLMEFMLSEAPRLVFRTLVAILLDCNSASIALLKKYGFSEWGRLPEIACLSGCYFDHLYYGKALPRLPER